MKPLLLLAVAALVSAVPTPVMAEPKAKLADLAWLAGTWEGEGIDGAPATEVYSPAAGGQMVGHFRQLKSDGTAMFYELITISERDGLPGFAIKHFNPDLTGWEERAEVRHFPMTAAKPGRWEFGALTYQRTGLNSMIAQVTTKQGEKPEVLTFRFKRKER